LGRIAFIDDQPYPKDLLLVEFGTGLEYAHDVWNWRED
jgi:hypothetical protein